MSDYNKRLSDAAIEYALSFGLVDDIISNEVERQTSFKAGAAWQTKQSPWISIDEQFPKDKHPVLCSSQIYGKVVLCYDELSRTWSYPESGEFYCDWDKVDCWMLIPEV